MSYKIYAVGELLKDVHFTGLSKEEISRINPKDIPQLIKNGNISSADDAGAPGNVAAYTVLLGGKADLLAAIGNDQWGQEIERNMQSLGVSLRLPKENGITKYGISTDAALIHAPNAGKHEFVKFFWDSMPLMSFSQKEKSRISKSNVVHVGSVAPCMFSRSRKAVYDAISEGRGQGKIISADLNLRSQVYDSPYARYEQAVFLAAEADVLKMSASELLFLSAINPNLGFDHSEPLNLEGLVAMGIRFQEIYDKRALFVTLGSAGAIGFSYDNLGWSSSYNFGPVKNAIGAGDAFMASALMVGNSLGLDKGVLAKSELNDVLYHACRAGGISVTGEETIVPRVKEHRELQGKTNFPSYDKFREAAADALKHELNTYKELRGMN